MSTTGRISIACLAAAAAITGCNRLVDGDYTPAPLAVVRGTPKDIFPSEPRLSFAVNWKPARAAERLVSGRVTLPPRGSTACVTLEDWEDPTCDGTPARGRLLCRSADDEMPLVRAIEAQQDLTHFEMPILELPPAGARADLSRLGGQGTFAIGWVAAFHDADGDGTFRFGTPENPPEPVLAYSIVSRHEQEPTGGPPSTSYFVAYLDGRLDPAALAEGEPELGGLPQGFSIVRLEVWSDARRRFLGRRLRILPMDANVVLVRVVHPDWEGLGCSEAIEEWRYLDAIPPGYAPFSCGPGETVSWHRGSGLFLGPDISTGPCTAVAERYEADFSCASGPLPSWHCPAWGDLTIRVATTSPAAGGPKQHGFVVRGESGETWASGTLDPSEDITLRFDAGPYSVELTPAPGCATANPSQTVTVFEEASSEVAFAVHCGSTGSAAPPGTAGGAATSAAWP